MKKAKTFTRVKRKRVTILTNNNQAKKLALLSISKADYEHNNA